MKEHYTQSGPYQGTHYIFESTTEAIKYLTGELSYLNKNGQDLSNELTAFKRWCDVEPGDWAKSDDGCVLQCLNKWHQIRKMKNGTPRIFVKSGRLVESKIFKYVIGAYSIFTKSDGSWASTKMWAMPKNIEGIQKVKSSIGEKNHYLGKYRTHKKMMFAIYLVTFEDPFMALERVQKQFKLKEYTSADDRNKAAETRIVVDLLSDPFIQEELNKMKLPNMDEFKKGLKQSLEKHGLSIDDSVKAIRDILDNPKSGGMVKLKAAETNANYHRYVADETNSLNPDGTKVGSNGKAIENAKFTEIESGHTLTPLPEIEEESDKKIEVVKSTFAEKLRIAEINAQPHKLSVDDILPE